MEKSEKATFAGGCFWCMEPVFKTLKGVLSVTSGYIGGVTKDPTYAQVCSGRSGHTEAVQIEFDPTKVSYQKLLEIFWQNHDPTNAQGQFIDEGSQYRPVIFYHTPEQRRAAEESKEALEASGRFLQPIVTEITAAPVFFPAEEYHQEYYKKNPLHYKMYRFGSGRDEFLEDMWGRESKKH